MAEGSSDSGIADHIVQIAAREDLPLYMSAPDFSLLEQRVGSRVQAKLDAAVKLGGRYDLVAVHRDADNVDPNSRVTEINAAVDAVMGTEMPRIAIVPIRMTEAWLLLDESAIRSVAGNPNGRIPLNLPTPAKAERIADPKALLKETLALAADVTGRRLQTFNKRFGYHRAQLLELLDQTGRVQQLESWRHFEKGVRDSLAA